jgi:hypothetical protein
MTGRSTGTAVHVDRGRDNGYRNPAESRPAGGMGGDELRARAWLFRRFGVGVYASPGGAR